MQAISLFCKRLRNRSSEMATRWASFASHSSDMAARSSNMAARWGCSNRDHMGCAFRADGIARQAASGRSGSSEQSYLPRPSIQTDCTTSTRNIDVSIPSRCDSLMRLQLNRFIKPCPSKSCITDHHHLHWDGHCNVLLCTTPVALTTPKAILLRPSSCSLMGSYWT